MTEITADVKDSASEPLGLGSVRDRQLNRGQLHVKLQTDEDGLKVHVSDARYLLVTGARSRSHIFIQVCLAGPADKSTAIQRTELQPFTASPCFDSTFIFKLGCEEERGRLVISLWAQNTSYGSPEFVGSMSFGLRHLLSKCSHHQGAGGVAGWYYLLSSQLGSRKHLLAQQSSTSKEEKSNMADSSSTLYSNHFLVKQAEKGSTDNMNTFMVSIPKLPTGYGFTVQGSCPVRVGNVKVTGAASGAGLRSGDHVLKVNGEDVSRSQASNVASLVRNSQHLTLEIYRPDCNIDLKPASVHQTALSSRMKHNHTYESLPSHSPVKVGCLGLNTKKYKHKSKSKRPLSCMQGNRDNIPAYKALQNENVPPQELTCELVDRFDHVPVLTDVKVTEKSFKVSDMHHSHSSPNLATPPLKAEPSRVVLRENTSHTTTPLREKLYLPNAKTPTAYLQQQMMSQPMFSQQGLEIHRWLDTVEQETTSLRKDSSYSNSSTSPEVSREQTVLQVSSASLCKSPTLQSSMYSQSTRWSSLDHTQNMVSDDNLKWDPGISYIENSQHSYLIDRDNDTNLDDYESETHNDSAFQSELDNAYISDVLEDADDRPLLLNTPTKHHQTYTDLSCMSEQSTQVQEASHMALIHNIPTLPTDTSSNYADSEASEESQMSTRLPSVSLSHLLHCEAEFVRRMQWGIGRYSRPMRHALLTPHEHKTVFQNIEKLVALSQFNLQQILSSHDLELEMDSMAMTLMVYRPRLKMLCEAYDHYLSGFADAVTFIHKLGQGHGQFAEFVKLEPEEAEEGGLTLKQFVQMPLKHLHDLLSCFKQCVEESHSKQKGLSPDTDALQQIYTDLAVIWQKWTPTDHHSSHGSWSPEVKGQTPCQDGSSTGGLDPKLVHLEKRLLAGSKAMNFQLAVPNRHVVYSSQLLFLEGSAIKPITAWLLSDMLILTKSEGKDALTLYDHPILLADVVSCELGCDHSCEFLLYHQRSFKAPPSLRTPSIPLACTRLRALAPEQRHAWHSILEHWISMSSH